MKPDILFKYVDAKRVDILRDGRARLSQPGALNDPFEMRPYVSAAASEEYIARQLHSGLSDSGEKLPAFDVFLAALRKKKPRAFTDMLAKHEMIGTEIRVEMQRGLNATTGVLCLTESPVSLLMWSRYADGHAGFVIGFNTSDSFFDTRNEWDGLFPVKYQSELPDVSLMDLTNEQLLCTKSLDWEYEAEWRLFRSLSEAMKELSGTPFPVFLFRVPASAVASITIGCRMVDDARASLVDAIRGNSHYSHVELLQAKPSERCYTIELTTVND